MKKCGLEQQAIAERPDDDGCIRLSIAISLKRIADALAPTEGIRFGEQLGQDIAGNIDQALGNALMHWIQNR